MDRNQVVYGAYMTFFVMLIGLIFAIPLLAFKSDVSALYSAFSYTCHQKLSRSLCLFNNEKGYWIGDCMPQTGTFANNATDRLQIRAEGENIGYKMPVCSRDVGLYGAMLIGGLMYPFVRRLKDRQMYPAIYLVLAIVPLGLDGSVQLISETGILPFVYESTNMMRLFTGAIAGFAAAFYAIPVLVNMLSDSEKTTKKKETTAKRDNPKK